MATKKIAPVDRAAVAKKAAALKVQKAKKPVTLETGEMVGRAEGAKKMAKLRK